VKIVVKAARLEDAKGPISLAAVAPPPGIVVKPAQIDPDQGEVTLSVTATPQVAADVMHNLITSGTLRVGQQPVVCTLPAIPAKVIAK
jgi:hypothetical protein